MFLLNYLSCNGFLDDRRNRLQGGGRYKVQGEGVYKIQGSEDFPEKGRL